MKGYAGLLLRLLSRYWLHPSSLGALDLIYIPHNALLPSFRLPLPVVRETRSNRAAQTNRIGEPKAAAKILNLAPRIKMITDDDRRRLEAQTTIKRKRKEREEKKKKCKKEDENDEKKMAEEVKNITTEDISLIKRCIT